VNLLPVRRDWIIFAAADYRCFSANFRQQAGRKWCFYAQSRLSVVDTVTMLTKGLEQS